jgi:hypothetical protein
MYKVLLKDLENYAEPSTLKYGKELANKNFFPINSIQILNILIVMIQKFIMLSGEIKIFGLIELQSKLILRIISSFFLHIAFVIKHITKCVNILFV